MMTGSDTSISKLKLSYSQQTLRNSFTCMGRGLHTGQQIIMTVMPAGANTGYRFIRKDVDCSRNEVLAAWHTVTDTHLCTTVSNNMGTRVSTIEHLMAALHASGVDNARIVLDGPEVPIMDGSARPFVQMIGSVGVVTLKEERKAIVIRKHVKVTDGKKEASLSPGPVPQVDIEIDFKSRVIGKQSLSITVNDNVFNHQIAAARTFGFVEQLTTLQQLGFARGGSLQNAILIGEQGVVNENGLRFEDEFVRHKVLDCIGDLALVGAHIIGRFSGKYTGHKLNNELLHELMLDNDAYDYMTLRELDQAGNGLIAAEVQEIDIFADLSGDRYLH